MMKPPFQKDRKLDLSTLEDWPRKAREDKAAMKEQNAVYRKALEEKVKQDEK